MKIYTKFGDTGETALYGGTRIQAKMQPQIEAIGTVDELNAYIGYAQTLIDDTDISDLMARDPKSSLRSRSRFGNTCDAHESR